MKNNRSAITVLILLFVIHTNSHAASQTWLGGDDNWLGNVLFWSSGIFPAAGDDIFINTNPNVRERLVVTGISPTINSLTIFANNIGILPNELHIASGHNVTVSGAGIVNHGIISLNAGNSTQLILQDNAAISGTGTITLSDSLNNVVRNAGGDGIFSLGTSATIQGAGRLVNNSGGMINNGTIIADKTSQLIIDTDTEGFVQAGTLRATGSGGLSIANTPTFTNTNGINIEAGSRLDVSASTIIGGEINIDPTAAASFINSTNLDGLTINGTVTHESGQTVDIFNGLTLNGQWNMNAGNATQLLFHGSETLTGDATINLSDSLNNIIRSNSGNDILTIDTDVTIQGAGRLVNNSGGMINNGTIIADKASQLVIDADIEGFENRGQLTASGIGGLRSVDSYNQTSGTTTVSSILEFTSNGELDLQGGVLNGDGIILGDVNNTGGTVNAGNSPGTLTINENYSQASGGTLLIEIAGTAGGEFDVLQINGDANLGGTIEVALLGNPGLSINDTFDVVFANEIFGAFDHSIINVGGTSFTVSIINELNQDIVRLTATSAVPVPPALWMLTSGLLLLFSKRRISKV